MSHWKAIIFLASLSLVAESLAAGVQITDPLLRQRAEALSASTLVGGEGWQAYERILHPGYSRWAMGEVYEGREKFVRSLEEWWNYGMRVATRDIEMVGYDQSGDIALVRYKTTETFVGPDGESVGFSGYVTNTWVRDNRDWKLLSAEISSLDRP
ncbi:MAG: nuclear transport factor 2 family protein [Xanthomonadales bacterium]|nr:nuclear transport factor 2 family protein [Xanthomonadales bacterium]